MENMGRTAETAVQAAKGITGSTLKMIAIISMFIDHTAAIVLERMLMMPVYASQGLFWVYFSMRMIGRLGFPIFCFLLIEGFCHTRNVKKYAGRLLLFALVSEIPFDLGFAGDPFFWQYQNVFFTLFIGLVVLMGFRWIERKSGWNKVLQVILMVFALAAGMFAANLLRTDYSEMGVLTIALMYLCRRNRVLEAGVGSAVLTAMSWSEVTAWLTMFPIWKYNGKRGWNLKWVFYVFYPAHIFLLYMAAYVMGLGQIMLRR